MRSVRGKLYFLSVLLVVATFTSIYRAPAAYAAQITNRKVTLTGVGGTGGSLPGGYVNHKFDFTIPTLGTALGSIKFEYCDVAQQTACNTPTGMDATTAAFGGESGATGFSILSATTNTVIIKRASASNPTTGALSYTLNNIKNPTTANYTFYIRISTYTSLNGTGSAIDTGSVAASTANPIQLQGVMPESLIFCTGVSITVTNNVPDCSTATNSIINFNQLFSASDTATASSVMAASTNATFGYAITVNGPTMTSGSNTIPAMATSAARTHGKSEFGMNLVANTVATSTVPVGANVSPTPDGINLRGQPSTGYNVVDQFRYVSGETVAASDNGGAGPTNGQLYTASYIVDVAGNQLSGTYSTTLTYICTPTF